MSNETWEETKTRLRKTLGLVSKKPTEIRIFKHEDVKPIGERWTIYRLTLPLKYSKMVALGFESKKDAEIFVKKHLKRYDEDGNVVAETVSDDDREYQVVYEVYREADGPLDIYANDSILTTVGNEREVVLNQWLS